MPRPTKCRRICHVPDVCLFAPMDREGIETPVLLTLDEYETIRLIDQEGHSQQQCSEQMGISRTTAQKIYETARRKLADALVNGRSLRIEGGDYTLCDGRAPGCRNKRCHRHPTEQSPIPRKGDKTMRIAVAVTCENGEIYQHFGRTEHFKVYDIEDGRIASGRIIGTDGQGHGALAAMLGMWQIDVLICGGIGQGAQAALAAAGIKLCGGVCGDADAAVEAFLAGTLNDHPDVCCSHHENGDHHCGSHGCEQGSCGKD